ncbi:putative meiotic phospholipase SPO1 [Nakaseomyces bracarensis]|uniref:Lysophospholipase n=1 Tax=Nakaseomyces bracarensis TaxID=273131 RepID=A0ABR4NNP7_9SACH
MSESVSWVWAWPCLCPCRSASAGPRARTRAGARAILNGNSSCFFIWMWALFLGLSLGIPVEVQCPGPLVRDGIQGFLCDSEVVYTSRKLVNNRVSMQQYLATTTPNATCNGDNAVITLGPGVPVPRIGVALSGGGYRSMLTSTGFMTGMHDIGLMQCTDYISGVSGGSWAIMDLVLSGFDPARLLEHWDLSRSLLPGIPEIDVRTDDDLISNNEFTKLSKRHIPSRSSADLRASTPNPPAALGITMLLKLKQLLFQNSSIATNSDSLLEQLKHFKENVEFYIDLHLGVRPKKMAGFPVSFTDYWAQSLMKNTNSFDVTFNKAVTESARFKNHTAPVPIIVATSRTGSRKNVIFEFTPWEFGSWDSQVSLFMKLQYLGSSITNGTAVKCFNGLDQLGYIAATSSSVFNNALVYVWRLISRSSVEAVKAVKTVMSIFGLGGSMNLELLDEDIEPGLDTDYAVYRHNPFYKYEKRDSEFTASDHLYLVDGGEDGENIPLRSLLSRNLDLVFMLDVSSDVDNYANGDKLKNVLHQVKVQERITYKYPTTIPENSPLILGCHFHHKKKLGHDHLPPILIYHANLPIYNNTNTSTFKMTYTPEEIDALRTHGRNMVTNYHDSKYEGCLRCIITKRSLDRLHRAPTDYCLDCYKNYCYS